MRIFIRDTEIRVNSLDKQVQHIQFDEYVDNGQNFEKCKFEGNICLKNLSKQQLVNLVRQIDNNAYPLLRTLVIYVNNVDDAKKMIKNQFSIIKAAGGLVMKDDKYLMIFRLKKWDLPKGKLEKDEKVEDAAIREVEEECNIVVKLEDKIGNTYHTYSMNGKKILKKTTWYKMSCISDKNMKPQVEEGIEKIDWFTEEEVLRNLTCSFGAVKEVFRKHHKKFYKEEGVFIEK